MAGKIKKGSWPKQQCEFKEEHEPHLWRNAEGKLVECAGLEMD